MALAYAVFFMSLIGLVGFFGLKDWEQKHHVTLFPKLRDSLDLAAARFHDLMVALSADIEKIPPEIVHVSRILVHESALWTASTLRTLAELAHRLADLVSHKRNFVRRAPRSEFLKKVIEHKNGSNGEVDTTP